METENWFSSATLLTIVVVLLSYVGYKYLHRNFDYFVKRGIKGPRPEIIVGTGGDFFKRPVHEVDMENYRKYGPIHGKFFLNAPILVAGDAEIAKIVLVKEFNMFRNRIKLPNPEPLFQKMMFFADNEQWKRLRSITSPTFTSGKMKKMYPLVSDCLQDFIKHLRKNATGGSEVNLKKAYGAFTMDVIASCAFATRTNTHEDPHNPFVVMGTRIFIPVFWERMVFFLPKFIGYLVYQIMSRLEELPSQFFAKITGEIITERRRTNHKNNDYLQLLMDATADDNNKGSEDFDNEEEAKAHAQATKLSASEGKNLTEQEIYAQAMLFFAAGFETTASTLAYSNYELTINPEMQQKLYEEVKSAFDDKDEISYETLISLPYLDAVLHETLRRYPPVLSVNRYVQDDYTLAGIPITKGVLVEIPLYCMHHDERYWKDPFKFHPERWMPENKNTIIPYTYLPFGAGPRNCVGMRFAYLEAKMALAHLILNFEFFKTANTPEKITYKLTKGPPFLMAADHTVGIRQRK